MDEQTLRSGLAGLSLPAIQYFDNLPSTNDLALAWADKGAPDFSLVVADSQSAGRGRLDRRWITVAGAALAFSLVLRPGAQETEHMALLSPLAGLAVSRAFEKLYNLHPIIKWPNDVLLSRKKVAGILAEAAWEGQKVNGVILGIGINVAPTAVPPAHELLFPATSVEEELGQPVDRIRLLRSVLEEVLIWRPTLGSTEFFQAWENRLAFRGEWVEASQSGNTALHGQVVRIDQDGNLILIDASGKEISITAGDIHLKSVDSIHLRPVDQ
jgi:BirA family transcriptional regulator, biotin operon repressor / biotin---[acetyl-CoA-carboxylase] ligase